MTRKVRIMGVQIAPVAGNKIENLKKTAHFISENSWFKPDLIVLPEVFNTGVDFEKVNEYAEVIPADQTTMFLSGFAEKYSTNIIGGSFFEKCPDGKIKNTSVFFDRTGQIKGKYSKIHMFSYFGSKEGSFVTPGDSAVIIDSDIGKIGLSICYDLRFPELYRTLAYAGAEIIVCPAAWPYPRYEHWITLTKTRALENQVFFIPVNQAGNFDKKRINIGNSMIINPWGEIISSAGGTEGVVMAEIDLEMIKKLREEFPVLNDRKLEAYKVL
mgnify:CR=1 FL=1